MKKDGRSTECHNPKVRVNRSLLTTIKCRSARIRELRFSYALYYYGVLTLLRRAYQLNRAGLLSLVQ